MDFSGDWDTYGVGWVASLVSINSNVTLTDTSSILSSSISMRKIQIGRKGVFE